MRRARSAEWLLATMTSLSPLATKTGLMILLRSWGAPRPASRMALSWASLACIEIRLSRSPVRSLRRAMYSDAARLPDASRLKNRKWRGARGGRAGLVGAPAADQGDLFLPPPP